MALHYLQDDEYVVYRPTQQKACYLVEYTVEGDTVNNLRPPTLNDYDCDWDLDYFDDSDDDMGI